MRKDYFQFDRNSFSVISLKENNGETDYWLSKTPEERIIAVEFLRQLIYGYDPATERLQRVFETAESKTS